MKLYCITHRQGSKGGITHFYKRKSEREKNTQMKEKRAKFCEPSATEIQQKQIHILPGAKRKRKKAKWVEERKKEKKRNGERLFTVTNNI